MTQTKSDHLWTTSYILFKSDLIFNIWWFSYIWIIFDSWIKLDLHIPDNINYDLIFYNYYHATGSTQSGTRYNFASSPLTWMRSYTINYILQCSIFRERDRDWNSLISLFENWPAIPTLFWAKSRGFLQLTSICKKKDFEGEKILWNSRNNLVLQKISDFLEVGKSFCFSGFVKISRIKLAYRPQWN